MTNARSFRNHLFHWIYHCFRFFRESPGLSLLSTPKIHKIHKSFYSLSAAVRNIIPVSPFAFWNFTQYVVWNKRPLVSNIWKPQILYHFSDIGKQSSWEADWYPQSYIPMHWTSKAAVLQMWSRINRSITPWELLRNENPPLIPDLLNQQPRGGTEHLCFNKPSMLYWCLKFENPGAVLYFSIILLFLL